MVLNKLPILILIFSIQFTYSQKVNWVSFEEAVELQKTNPKNIMMDVYTEWCGPCKMMDKNTFENPLIAKFLNDNFYAVKFNAEGTEKVSYNGKVYGNPNFKSGRIRNSSHDFSRYLGIYSYPTIVFFDKNSKPIAPIRGYQGPTQIEVYLNLFLGDKYLSVTNQDEFREFLSSMHSMFKS